MRELEEHILTEEYKKIEGSLTFSVKLAELTAYPGETARGSFWISASGPAAACGRVCTGDERMKCSAEWFDGGREQIGFTFDAAELEPGDSRQGRFLILSNYGEYELGWRVVVAEKPAAGAAGPVEDLDGFAALARTDWREAVRLFYSGDFSGLVRREKKAALLYRGLSASFGNEANVEAFLEAAGKKQPVRFWPVQREICADQLQGQVSEEIRILREGWGPVQLRVEAEGDFIALEKTRIGEDDFLGNLCRLPVFLDGERMHDGRNFGEVRVSWYGGGFTVPVTAVRHRALPRLGERRSLSLKKSSAELVELYEQMRTRRIGQEEWLEKARDCIGRMARQGQDRTVVQLFEVQLLITEERQEEAGAVLRRLKEHILSCPPAVVCYYLYLTTLYDRREEYVRRAARKVEEIFAQNPGEWRIAWLLLFLSREVNYSAQRRWQFLEKQYRAGCVSPVLYLEGLSVLNANPALLTLDRVAVRVLMYGAKRGLLGADLTGQLAELASREKYFDRTLFAVLRLAWEKRPEDRLLHAICSLLIKGGRTGKEWHVWYARGVEKKLRVTRLYEYYLMSLDMEKEETLPKSVLLYFAYQSNLDWEYSAYLYVCVERCRQEDPELYIAYKPQIDRFLLDCLLKGRISKRLAWLYQRNLTADMLTEESGRALAGLLCTVLVSLPDLACKKLVLVQGCLRGEESWALQEGKACVCAVGKDFALFVQDEAGNRRCVSGQACLEPLFDGAEAERLWGRENLLRWGRGLVSFQLACAGEQPFCVTGDNVDCCLALAAQKRLDRDSGQSLRWAILTFFRHQGSRRQLRLFLAGLRDEDLSPAHRLETVACLTEEGLCEKAYGWMAGQDARALDARVLLRLCSGLLERRLFAGQQRMTGLCAAAALRGKYDGRILQELTDFYEGSCAELEVIKGAAEGFGIDTWPLCRRLIAQLLFTGKDVTERMELLRQYAREGGPWGLERAFLHRCAYSYVMEKQPVHIYMIQEMLRMERCHEPVTPLCRIACLRYFARNKGQLDEKTVRWIRTAAGALLEQGCLLPEIKEFLELVPGAYVLADKTFVVYQDSAAVRPVLNYRVVREEEQEDYRSAELLAVCSGIYVSCFILFPGESLQYYVTERENPSEILESGLLKAESCPEAAASTRFGMLCAAADGRRSSAERLDILSDYLYRQFGAEKLF
ncbi:MAG: DUF5717 family protein [Eubacteriales bacterium]|nr:DUF5717 family protein [Eubacteriales bacterium]